MLVFCVFWRKQIFSLNRVRIKDGFLPRMPLCLFLDVRIHRKMTANGWTEKNQSAIAVLRHNWEICIRLGKTNGSEVTPAQFKTQHLVYITRG